MKDRAAEIIESGSVGEILKMALNARAAVDEGRYCECDQPVLSGDALMCGGCLLRNRTQEIRRVHQIRGCPWFRAREAPWPYVCRVHAPVGRSTPSWSTSRGSDIVGHDRVWRVMQVTQKSEGVVALSAHISEAGCLTASYNTVEAASDRPSLDHARVLVTLGYVFLAIGLILLVLGAVGHPVGGRPYWY